MFCSLCVCVCVCVCIRRCVCVCVCVCVYGEFPRECDITQRGLLLGVLLLLPATPLLESMILHTHTLAPTEVTPTGPNFPLHLQPASRCVLLCVSVCVCVCVCVCADCLPACQPIKSMLATETLPGLLPLAKPASQPIKTAQSADPPLPRSIGQSQGAAHRKGLSPGL